MTTLIKGGTIYDGTGDAPREADVLLHGSTIARLAPRLNVNVKTVIEARGALVTPGFVDIANYADHYGALFSDPAGTELVIRGITSVVVGQGGVSLSPLLSHGAASEGWWGNAAATTAHATTLKDFFSLLKGRIGVNIGTLVGYTTVREGITRGGSRDLTDREFELLEHTLRTSLREGALGISANLEHIRALRVPHHELLAIARATADANALFALRLRDREADLKASFVEALALSEATGTNLLITDLEPYASEDAAYRALLTQITRGSAEHNVHFTTSGNGTAAIPLPLLLPPHLREPEWSLMCARLKEPTVHEELRVHLSRYRDMEFHIGAVADPSLKLFEGTPFSKWSLHEHLSFEDALLRLMIVTGFRAILVANVGNQELANMFASHDRAFISSGEAAAPSRESSAHLRFIEGKSGSTLPIEQRVARVTGGPAKKLGLVRRGFLREGYHADIAVIERGVVREAFVNGACAVAGGTPTGHRSGELLVRK